MRGYRTFSTALGYMGLAWQEDKVLRLWLPDRDRKSLHRRIEKEIQESMGGAFPDEPPKWFGGLVESIKKYTRGTVDEPSVLFSQVPLYTQKLPPFYSAVFKRVRKIPVGEVLTYGEVARDCGSPRGARAVGQAMAKNPYPFLVPCHRVLGAGGALVGFRAYRGVHLKQQLLALENYEPK